MITSCRYQATVESLDNTPIWTFYLHKSSVDLSEITTFLHRNQSKMVFFADPGEEGLVLVVVDTSSNIPVFVATSVSQHTVNSKTTTLMKCFFTNRLFMHLTFVGSKESV